MPTDQRNKPVNASIDAKVEMQGGGAFEIRMLSPSGEKHRTCGTFVEVTPHGRLVIDLYATYLESLPLFRAYTEVTFTDVVRDNNYFGIREFH